MTRICRGTTRDGSPCNRAAARGDYFCTTHTPEAVYDPNQPPFGSPGTWADPFAVTHTCDWDAAPVVDGAWLDHDALAAVNLRRCPVCDNERLIYLDPLFVQGWCAERREKEADR